MENNVIQRGLDCLIGEDNRKKYERYIFDCFKESEEYFDDVKEQSNKDLATLSAFISKKDGDVGILVYPKNLGSEAETYIDLRQLLVDEILAGERDLLTPLRDVLTEAIALIDEQP